MSIATIMLIIKIAGLSLGAILLIGIGFVIGWTIWKLRNTDNAKRATILIDTGSQTIPVPGKLLQTDGANMTYQYLDKVITIPAEYGLNFVKHRRKIEVTSGNELIFPAGKPILGQGEYSQIVMELTLGHIGADAIKAVKSAEKSKIGIMFIIIAFVVGLAIAGFVLPRITAMTQQPAPAPAIQPAPAIDNPQGVIIQ